jgi:glycosyltransferase involved in cell wall biosynthesis/thioredoxin-like negative regulator of GroEL
LVQTGQIFDLPVPDPAREQLPAGVSLCMIVKNEERFLDECLRSVKDAVDEICIVDTGSTDRTVEIARSYGANVIFREWRNDFSWARNESLQMATRRWTLVLDGDEELTPSSVPLVRAVGQTPAEMTALYVNIVNYVDDAMGLGTASHRLARLFPTNPNLRYCNVIHESLYAVGADILDVKLSTVTVIHKGYTADMLKAREKGARNMPLLKRAFEENGDDPFALFNFGNSAICAGDYDVGIEVLEKLLAMMDQPKMYFPIAYVMLAQGYFEGRNDYEHALEVLERGAAAFPRDAGILFLRGQVKSNLKRTAEAREDFERVIQMRDQQQATVLTDEEIFEWKVHYAMAGTYERDGDLEGAVRCVERALVNKPKSAPLLRSAGDLYERLERYHEADRYFRACADVSPEAGRVQLINFLLRRSRFADAAEQVEQLGGEGAASLRVLVNVTAAQAMIKMQAGDPARYLEAALRDEPGNGEAISLFETFLAANPDPARLERLHREELDAPLRHVGDYTRRTSRLLSLNRPAEAAEVGLQGRERFPDDGRLAFNTALALARAGRDREAAPIFASISPDDTAVYGDAMQTHAALMMRMGDAPAARASVHNWASAQAPSAEAFVSGARWLVQSNFRDEAIALLRGFPESNTKIAAELASLLVAAGDFAGAEAVANRALE